MTTLGAFNNQLIRFFEDLYNTFPEERDIKSALEMIKFAKASNPKIILDLFYEHVYVSLSEPIEREDSDFVVSYAKSKIENQFNEISPALIIFQKYWDTISDNSKKSIWNYLKVLCILCARAKGISA
jgi:hypothetical protein